MKTLEDIIQAFGVLLRDLDVSRETIAEVLREKRKEKIIETIKRHFDSYSVKDLDEAIAATQKLPSELEKHKVILKSHLPLKGEAAIPMKTLRRKKNADETH